MMEMVSYCAPLEGGDSMVKAIGICFMAISCGMIGFYKSLEFSERLHNLIHLKRCFLLVRGEIRYQPAPFPELYK